MTAPQIDHITKELSETGTIENKNVINGLLKSELHGIWASHQYLELLQEAKSVTEAENSIHNYTTIVFDGDETLHCHKPTYMEDDLLTLHSDSSTLDYKGNVIFNIATIQDDTMVVIDSMGTHLTYMRVADVADTTKLYMEVTKGHNLLELQWLSGTYEIELKSDKKAIELLPSGKVKGFSPMQSFSLYSYEGLDMIDFELEKGLSKSYVMVFNPDMTIELKGIGPIESDDSPVIYDGDNGVLRKLKN